MIVYYGLTDKEGGFTLLNLAQITTPENLKALGLALLLSFISTLLCLVLAYPLAIEFFRKKCKSDQLHCSDIHPAHVDEFSSAHTGVAEPAGKERDHQQHSGILPSPGADAD